MTGICALNISFKNNKLEKCFNSIKEARRAWGESAVRVLQRLNELRAADTLEDMGYLPPARCHEIGKIRPECFAVITVQPARMVFKPDHNPIPKKPDGGYDLSKITKIIILEVEDYHGKQKRK